MLLLAIFSPESMAQKIKIALGNVTSLSHKRFISTRLDNLKIDCVPLPFLRVGCVGIATLVIHFCWHFILFYFTVVWVRLML
jgi:hypothetical protein